MQNALIIIFRDVIIDFFNVKKLTYLSVIKYKHFYSSMLFFLDFKSSGNFEFTSLCVSVNIHDIYIYMIFESQS